ncbi:iron(III) transport system ATP-binding protein [Naumannella cuiyingiana]|uniref:ABC-type quaternary amine transporter n=1 Tax=Naumannella cuiyingiana TaxID=1347891 RepID=A0A7Z0D985_9ACTN|nr:iron(III) transport system ATP-binding protein [Naumannella cuiyingiana]
MSDLEVRGAARRFGDVPALDGVDLEVPSGRLLAVLGPSGCGKTTLLRAIAGIARPDAGTIVLGGQTLDGPRVHLPPERRGVGLVPQEGALFPHLTVAGNVGFGLRRLARPERAERVSAMLELVGLGGLDARGVDELSGGQQQRVALARALAPQPGVVLLDEPFSALDAALRAELRAEVAALLRRIGATALLVTHDQTEALMMADAVAVMRDGRIVQHGPPREVYARPVDPWVARFVGEAVLLDGELDGSLVRTAAGPVPVAAPARPAGPRVLAFVRPEQVVPDPEGAAARVLGLRYAGPDGLVRLELGDGTAISARWPAHALPTPGESVRIRLVGEAMAYPAD